MIESENKYRPDWADRAENIQHKPNWVDKIPHELWELGEVFFPIPKGRKGWGYPHHKQEYRYRPDDEILNAYLESGSGYGISCAADLIVVDIDTPGMVEELADVLPDSLHQVTGSRTGIHIFYYCEDLDTRKTLYYYMLDEKFHIGEIKADPHGYIVGPGSKHPSGNKYGPLRGDEIVRIEKDEILDLLDEYINNNKVQNWRGFSQRDEYDSNKLSQGTKYEFYNLDADDVIPWLEPENRVPHPEHGSTTWEKTNGKIGNFMKNKDRETFTCWRCTYGRGEGCGLNAIQLLAQMETGEPCDEIRSRWGIDLELFWYSWKKAVRKGLISYEKIPYKVAKGYAVKEGYIEEDDELTGDIYWDTLNIIKCIIEEPYIRSKPPDNDKDNNE